MTTRKKQPSIKLSSFNLPPEPSESKVFLLRNLAVSTKGITPPPNDTITFQYGDVGSDKDNFKDCRNLNKNPNRLLNKNNIEKRNQSSRSTFTNVNNKNKLVKSIRQILIRVYNSLQKLCDDDEDEGSYDGTKSSTKRCSPTEEDPLFSSDDESDDDDDPRRGTKIPTDLLTLLQDRLGIIGVVFAILFVLLIGYIPLAFILGLVISSRIAICGVRTRHKKKYKKRRLRQRFNDCLENIQIINRLSCEQDTMTQIKVDLQVVTKVALASRVILLGIQIIASNLLSCYRHHNDGFKFTPEEGYGKLLDPIFNSTFGGLANWDGHFFLHIAVKGYTEENIMAFFPLFPMMLYYMAKFLHTFLYAIISLSSLVLLVGWTLNTGCFILSARYIYKLAKIFNITNPTISVLLFCYNPASIFFSSLYTESLFMLLTIQTVLALYEGNTVKSLMFASLSAICRSNGLLNFGFIAAFIVHKAIEKHGSQKRMIIQEVLCKGFLSVWFLFPFLAFQMYGVNKFCTRETTTAMIALPPYCNYKMFPYSYVQQHYWNVGFLRYFELKQIPNFLLAIPILYFQTITNWSDCENLMRSFLRYKLEDSYRLYVSLHGLFLAGFCFLFVHVQVSTRMILSAFPYIYIFLAGSCQDELEKFRNRRVVYPTLTGMVQIWCVSYYVIGGIAFPLGYPWT